MLRKPAIQAMRDRATRNRFTSTSSSPSKWQQKYCWLIQTFSEQTLSAYNK